MRKTKYSAHALLVLTTGLVAFMSNNAIANMFVPMQPCNGCTIDISDHAGIAQTSKNGLPG